MSTNIIRGVTPVGRSDSQVIHVDRVFESRVPLQNPTVVATTVQDPDWHGQISDTFAVTITNVSPFGFSANVIRIDEQHGWDQNLQLSWAIFHD